MPDRTITTSTGAIVSLAHNGEDTMVLLDHPKAPADMRPTEAGRVIDCGFQFMMQAPASSDELAEFSDWSLSPEALRAIADIIDGGTTAIAEAEPTTPALQLIEGRVYRNDVGAELHAVGPLLGMLGSHDVLIPGAWTFQQHHRVLGTIPCLSTAEGLTACGYTLVTEEAGSDGE